MNSRQNGTAIEDADLQQRIIRACSAMPYTANTGLMQLQSIGTGGRSGCTLEALADWLERFAEVLEVHATKCATHQHELHRVKRDIRAAARVVDLVLGESKLVGQLKALAELERDELDGLQEEQG